jgi:fructokinase
VRNPDTASWVKDDELSLQIKGDLPGTRVLVLGEVLWDVFPDSTRLRGAPLNFAAHAQRMGHQPSLISAVGEDDLGNRALRTIESLGLNTDLLQRTNRFPTGTARVHLGPTGQTTFSIPRPSAYDAVNLSGEQIARIQQWSPQWFYFGTLFPVLPEGHATLRRLLCAVPEAMRLYDLNLRPGFDSQPLVLELLEAAQVVKLNQEEMYTVGQFCGLPLETEAFCRIGSQRFQWEAVCVTMGARGCAIFARGEYVEDAGYHVDVADTVGAGDAFAAAFLHGLTTEWSLAEIARFSNRVGALVASRPGAIPDWTFAEAKQL